MRFFARLSFCLLVAAILFVPLASAHRINIFAWAEKGRIHTESVFSGGRKAQKASVTVTRSDTGKELMHGTTDAKGGWSFLIPPTLADEGADLLIVVQAGEGHRGQWLIQAEEYKKALATNTALVDDRQGPGGLQIAIGVGSLLFLGGAVQWLRRRQR